MKIVTADFELIEEEIKAKRVERVTRACCKWRGEPGEGSGQEVVKTLLSKEALEPFEHASAVFEVTPGLYRAFQEMVALCAGEKTLQGKNHSKVDLRMTKMETKSEPDRYLVSGSVRAWYEFARCLFEDSELFFAIPNVLDKALFFINEHVEGVLTEMLPRIGERAKESVLAQVAANDVIREIVDFETLTAKERMVHERFSVLFVCDNETACKLMRLRDASFLTGHALGNEAVVINPNFFDETLVKRKEPVPLVRTPFKVWEEACKAADRRYKELVELGVPKWQAGMILPQCTKTNLIMTASLGDWRRAFEQEPTLVPLLGEVKGRWPFAFGNIKLKWFTK